MIWENESNHSGKDPKTTDDRCSSTIITHSFIFITISFIIIKLYFIGFREKIRKYQIFPSQRAIFFSLSVLHEIELDPFAHALIVDLLVFNAKKGNWLAECPFLRESSMISVVRAQINQPGGSSDQDPAEVLREVLFEEDAHLEGINDRDNNSEALVIENTQGNSIKVNEPVENKENVDEIVSQDFCNSD